MKFWWMLTLMAWLSPVWAQPSPEGETITIPTSPPALYLTTEVNLVGFQWSELGLSDGESFISPLREAWLKWLTENAPAEGMKVQSCDAECLAFQRQWEGLSMEKIPAEALKKYQGSHWLKVVINLRRLTSNPALMEYEFEWDGRVVRVDIASKKTLNTYELSTEKKLWRNLDQKTLNSTLASHIYRSPLGYFAALLKKPASGNIRLSRLVIQGHRHMGDVLAVMNLLKARGASLGLSAEMDVFSGKEAKLLIYYQGEEKSFTDLLSQLKELKSSQSYMLVSEFDGTHHRLKLVTQ